MALARRRCQHAPVFLPPWLTFTCAALVIVWGVYRVKVGLRSEAAEERALAKKGLYAMPRRTHLLIGAVYVLLGVSLAAIGFGWRPFGIIVGSDQSTRSDHSTDIELRPTPGSQSPQSAPVPAATK